MTVANPKTSSFQRPRAVFRRVSQNGGTLCFVHLVKRHKIPHLDSAAEEGAASLTKFGMTKVCCIEEIPCISMVR
jgi:hypothetical protein